MRINDIELTVNIAGKDRPVTEYPHNGSTYIEGRSNSKFEICLKNHGREELEVVVSVDGLSIIDGKEAGTQSSGYLVKAGETTRIPGWKLNDREVAAFVFAANEGSYAAHVSGHTRNTGVIGVMAFRNKVRPQPVTYSTMNRLCLGSISPTIQKGVMRGISGGWAGSGSSDASYLNGGATGINTMSALGLTGSSATLSAQCMNTASLESCTLSAGQNSADATVQAAAAVAQTLGTGFGERTDFATTSVSWSRGDMHAMGVIFYDERRSLIQRGVPIDRKVSKGKATIPNAFPAMAGCTPPPNWVG